MENYKGLNIHIIGVPHPPKKEQGGFRKSTWRNIQIWSNYKPTNPRAQLPLT